MTSRALARAGLAPVPHIDLPVGSRPQHVNERGIEIDEEDIHTPTGYAAVGVQQESSNVDVDVEMAEEEMYDLVEVDKEPLLSLAESLVLPFSLAQTRQRHLTHLLPHMFSHPPIPSNAKPRARGPAKGTFLFPTPVPLPAPLPLKEYHGSSRHLEPPTIPQAAPSPIVVRQDSIESGTPAAEDSIIPSTHTPTASKPKTKKQERLDAPAHEIDCIARVTLAIGPISYPGTELWIGRFVEPKGDAKTIRQREKGEKLPRAEKKERKRPTIPGMSLAGPSVRPATGYRPPVRPVVTPGPPPRMPGGPLPRPPSGPTPTRPPIEPSLIQRVNFAATQHPWLSVIIHKAARNSASKEELAKLGRIVARLGKGEGVGEGPLDGLPPSSAAASKPSGPSTSRPEPSTAPSTTLPNPVTMSAPNSVLPEVEGEDSSDDEAVMTGRPQIGGGPIDPELQPDVAKKPENAPYSLLPTPLSSQSPIDSTLLDARPTATSSINSTTSPLNNKPFDPLLPPKDSSSFDRPSMPTYAVPPRRIYPLPPPFLLVAFKETPTEKYLLPLGSNSYISRVGSSTATTNPENPAEAAPLSHTGPASEPALATTSAQPLEEPHVLPGKGRSRTRKSLGRGAKDVANIESPAEKEGPTMEQALAIEPLQGSAANVSRSDLPILPGMRPSNGTVLLSTVVPTNGWNKPVWETLEQRLPFYNTQYDTKSVTGTEANTPVDAAPPAQSPKEKKKQPVSPIKNRHGRIPAASSIQLDPKSLLNLGAERFLPIEGDVQAVTIRLEDVDDATWLKMRWVIEHVDGVEMKAFGNVQPDLFEQIPPPAPSSLPRAPEPFDPCLHPRLRAAYSDWKKAHLGHLLRRVPSRKFPRYRLSAPRSDLKDATTDRWAPRPYPMSTRPLYLTSPPPDDMVYVSEETSVPKRKRGQAEEEVMFEMPVSLDMLDERVEAGAKKSVNRRVGKLKLDKARRINADGKLGKRFGKRYKIGTICEGCAGEGLKVWRRGPGGKGTLCNECGDKFSAGTLGELKAPGAASMGNEEAEQEGADTEEGGGGDERAENVKREATESGVIVADGETTIISDTPVADQLEGEGGDATGVPLPANLEATGALDNSIALADPSTTVDNQVAAVADIAAPSTSGT